MQMSGFAYDRSGRPLTGAWIETEKSIAANVLRWSPPHGGVD
jgi:hypothetical protein